MDKRPPTPQEYTDWTLPVSPLVEARLSPDYMASVRIVMTGLQKRGISEFIMADAGTNPQPGQPIQEAKFLCITEGRLLPISPTAIQLAVTGESQFKRRPNIFHPKINTTVITEQRCVEILNQELSELSEFRFTDETEDDNRDNLRLRLKMLQVYKYLQRDNLVQGIITPQIAEVWDAIDQQLVQIRANL